MLGGLKLLVAKKAARRSGRHRGNSLSASAALAAALIVSRRRQRVASRAERVSAIAMPLEASFPSETRLISSGSVRTSATGRRVFLLRIWL